MASSILTTRTIRILLIIIALAAAVATTISLVRHQLPTRIGTSLADPTRSTKANTFLHFTFQEFRPAGNQFAGALQIDVSPNLDRFEPADIKQWAESYKQLVLRLDHYDPKTNSLTYQGGSDDRIALSAPPAWGAFRGKGNFSWTAVPDNGPFFYPFDRYTLHLNPALMEVSNPALYPIVQIDTVETDFGNSNFIPHLHNLNAKYPSDPYDITLDRPILLRTLALIVAALFILWLIYLIWSAKPGEQAGQVVTLFVGVFSIRGSLLSGAPLFPSLIDYCALAVYLAATLIVLIRWMLPGKSTKDCPFCASPIPLPATVCPQCTRKLSPSAEKSA